MKEDLERLKELQRLDDGIRAGDESVARLRKQADDLEAEIARMQQSMGKRGDEARALKLHAKAKEAELAAAEAEITKLEQQLNQATSNKEFSAIRHQMETVRAKASRIEDETLAMMEQIEGGDETLRQMKGDLSQHEAGAAEKKAEIQEKIAAVEEHRAELVGKRRELAEQIRPSLFDLYERVHKSRPDGKGVAAVRNFACLGCQMTLPPNVVNNLMIAQEAQVCRTCSRILYLDEG